MIFKYSFVDIISRQVIDLLVVFNELLELFCSQSVQGLNQDETELD